MRKKKEQEEFVVTSESMARQILSEAENKLEKQRIGVEISLAATILSCVSYFPVALAGNKDFMALLLLVAFVGAVISYIICGGLGGVLHAAYHIACFGFTVFPGFIFGAIAFCVCGYYSLIALFFLPIIFTSKKYKETKEECKLAMMYLGYLGMED